MSNGKENMTTKRCTRCKQDKELSLFSKNKKAKDGLQSWCQKCMSESRSIRYKYKKPPSLQSETWTAYIKKWRSIPTNYEANIIRSRNNALIHRLIDNPDKVKDEKVIEIFGIDKQGFINYFQSLFEKGMSWKNYGAWHLDHKKGLTHFDLTKEENRKIANHYTNIQPAWGLTNFSRRRKEKRVA